MNREEAINVIKGARQYLTVGNPIWNVKKVDEAMNMAIEALSIDAVQGEWESLKVVDISRSGVQELQEQQCSHCGKWLTTPYMYYPKKHNFCPNCGAKMKGGAE